VYFKIDANKKKNEELEAVAERKRVCPLISGTDPWFVE